MPLQPLPDYSIGLPDPTETVRKNLETAMAVGQAQDRNQLFNVQMQEHQLKVQEAQRAEAAKQQQAVDLAALMKDPTPQNIAATGIKYPALTENLIKNFELLDSADQKAQLGVMEKVHMASLNDSPDAARQVLEVAATASENSGNKKRAEDLRSTAAQIEKNPTGVKVIIGAALARIKGGDEYMKTFGQVATQKTADIEADKRAAKLDSEINQANSAAVASRAAAAKSGSDQKIAEGAAPLDLAAKLVAAKTTGPLADAKLMKDQAEAVNAANLYKAGADEAVAKAKTAGNLTSSEYLAAVRDQEVANAKVAQAKGDYARWDQAAKLGDTTSGSRLKNAEAAVAEGKLGELKPETVKSINEQMDLALNAAKDAEKFGTMAGTFEKAAKEGATSGPLTRAQESFKAWWGSGDKRTEMFQAFNRVNNEQTLKTLKGTGRITEKEIELIKGGIPDAKAGAAIVAPYLRLLEKLNKSESELYKVKSEWMRQNDSGVLTTATKAFDINGHRVEKGEDLFKYQQKRRAEEVDAKLAELRKAK